MELHLSHLNQNQQAAKQLLDFAGTHRIFLFYGEMGAGKTTFIKSLCEVLGVDDNVSSPTFSIVNEYVLPDHNVYHFDFYRIKKEAEALDLGYEDYLYSGDYCFIEWPEKIAGLLPATYVEVRLTEISESSRLLKVRMVN